MIVHQQRIAGLRVRIDRDLPVFALSTLNDPNDRLPVRLSIEHAANVVQRVEADLVVGRQHGRRRHGQPRELDDTLRPIHRRGKRIRRARPAVHPEGKALFDGPRLRSAKEL
ncbi:hypothetical protein SDC9_209140 [bioreactor metagenome]|uniref:Uncharacterized protein n=1 Tax=bioreactor metagenome TaxID=1076179 RepID=A0A645JP90_9ZZZZ